MQFVNRSLWNIPFFSSVVLVVVLVVVEVVVVGLVVVVVVVVLVVVVVVVFAVVLVVDVVFSCFSLPRRRFGNFRRNSARFSAGVIPAFFSLKARRAFAFSFSIRDLRILGVHFAKHRDKINKIKMRIIKVRQK